MILFLSFPFAQFSACRERSFLRKSPLSIPSFFSRIFFHALIYSHPQPSAFKTQEWLAFRDNPLSVVGIYLTFSFFFFLKLLSRRFSSSPSISVLHHHPEPPPEDFSVVLRLLSPSFQVLRVLSRRLLLSCIKTIASSVGQEVLLILLLPFY